LQNINREQLKFCKENTNQNQWLISTIKFSLSQVYI
jgi:hypothetical protein